MKTGSYIPQGLNSDSKIDASREIFNDLTKDWSDKDFKKLNRMDARDREVILHKMGYIVIEHRYQIRTVLKKWR